MRRGRLVSQGFLLSWMALFWSLALPAQDVTVPNPSFERGQESPEGWTLSGGQGGWIREAAHGKRAISATGQAGPGRPTTGAPLICPSNPTPSTNFAFRPAGWKGQGAVPSPVLSSAIAISRDSARNGPPSRPDS